MSLGRQKRNKNDNNLFYDYNIVMWIFGWRICYTAIISDLRPLLLTVFVVIMTMAN
jgi:hypothetical protein